MTHHGDHQRETDDDHHQFEISEPQGFRYEADVGRQFGKPEPGQNGPDDIQDEYGDWWQFASFRRE